MLIALFSNILLELHNMGYTDHGAIIVYYLNNCIYTVRQMDVFKVRVYLRAEVFCGRNKQ